MHINPRCSRCGQALPDLQEGEKIIEGKLRKIRRRPGVFRLHWAITSPEGVALDGVGFDDFVTARLAKLQLPLCIRVENGEIAGCFADLIETLEAWWDTT